MSPETGTQKEFGKVRSILWPIHGYEMKKFFPMSMMMLLILFIYTLVRDLKDALVLNLPGAEAQSTSMLKLWLVLPAAMIAVLIFGKCLSKFDFNKTFYITVVSFLIYFAVFAFVLTPLKGSLHMKAEAVKKMQSTLPAFLALFVPLIGGWVDSIFYVVSEIWGSLVIGSLFWQFANKTTMKSEVSRFYGLFACLGNVGLIFSGFFLDFVSKNFKGVQNIQVLISGVLLCGAILVFIFYHINKNVLCDPKFFDKTQVKVKKKKAKLSLGQSFKEVCKSSYLMYIAILTISYGVAINLSETVMKTQMKDLCGNTELYTATMAKLSMATGVFTIIATFIGSNVLRKCKWRTSALITPVFVMVLGSLFFGVVILENVMGGPKAQMFGIALLNIAVFFGVSQDAIAKSIKYSLFDSTKQMAYLPLDENLKANGQAAVETVGGRLGKSLGSFLVIVFASIVGANAKMSNHVWYPVLIVAIVGFLWIMSVFKLSGKYETLKNKRAKEESKDAA